MKKILLAFSLFVTCSLYSQTPAFPDFINYQAVLRDVNGTVLAPGTNGTLKFKVYDDLVTTSATYEEDHNFTTNSVGMVILQIGKGTQVGANTVQAINWSGGKVSYEVYLNGSLISPKQAFATVPYAIYSLKSGNSLQNGLPNQTLYWDGTQSKWIPTSNLNNNGTNIGIGISPANFGNKLHVHSINPTDSSTIFASKSNANGRDAAFRGFASGTTFASSPNMSQSIYGADVYGANNGTGPGIGVSGIGISSGYAYGLVGLASVNSPTGYAIGVYGAVAGGTTSPNSFAGYLDGTVFIRDSLFLGNIANPGLPGDVLTRTSTGKAKWKTLTGSSPISIAQGGIVNVNPLTPSTNFTISAAAPVFTSTGIGSISPASYPNYILNIPPPNYVGQGLANMFGAYPNFTVNVPTPNMSFNNASGIYTYLQGPYSNTINLSPNLSLAGTTLSAGSNTVNLPGLNLWSAPTLTAVALTVGSNSVGIGTVSPLAKLDVNGNIKITDGSQAAGRVLTSDATGTASWQPVSMISSIVVSCQNIASVGTTPIAFPNSLINFTKNYNDTKVEVILQTDLNVFDFLGGCNSVRYEIRLNGNPPPNNTGKATYYWDNNGSNAVTNNRSVTMIAEFTNLPAGVYVAELYASSPFGGNASSVYIDPGCFGASSVVVKEYK